jgi:hypothetical protein
MIRSCGMEGFKNTRKGTNIAAQATAIGLATVNIYYFLERTNVFFFVNRMNILLSKLTI